MMAAEGNVIRYVITGEDDEVIPENATQVSVHPSVRIISSRLFRSHPNIVELICHDGVIKIEAEAFCACPRLKRVIMKSVEELEGIAFGWCKALEYVECDKLEIIGHEAFICCKSITDINLPSAKIVSFSVFYACQALVDAKFGRKLESIGGGVFYNCRSLQRITFPLRNGLFDRDGTFRNCENLRHIDLIEGAVLQLTIDALLWEEWKNNLNAELVSIDQILPNTHAGHLNNNGDKAIVIRQWIRNVLHKIIMYKVKHRRLLKEAESRLQLALPHDIVTNNIVPFFTLPQHTFDGEDEIDDSDGSNKGIDERYSSDADSDEEDDNHDVGQGGAMDTGEEGKREGANYKERRKRRRTGNNDGD